MIHKIFKAILASFRNSTQNTCSSLNLRGAYASYAAAAAQSEGYGSPIILQKVQNAIIQLLNGKGIYERDGTLFNDRPIPFMMREILRKTILPNSIIVDFGGGLGGLFINNLDLFGAKNQLYVVEQRDWVVAGNEISSGYSLGIKFISSIEQAPESPDIFILSGVLMYLEDAASVLSWVKSKRPKLIVIDRTAFADPGQSELWFLQYEATYYGAPISYPFRSLSEVEIMEALGGYHIVDRWQNNFDVDYPRHCGISLAPCRP